MTHLPADQRAWLRQFLQDSYSLSELKTLAFDLGVEYELFAYEGKADLARELLHFFDRRQRLSCLVDYVRRGRPEHPEQLEHLAASLPPCVPHGKVQIIVSAALIEDEAALIAAVAQLFRVPADAVSLVAAAWSSLHLLLSVPQTAVDFRQLSTAAERWTGPGVLLSIEAFTFLSDSAQTAWQLIAMRYPPASAGTQLLPTISWQEAQRQAGPESPPPLTPGRTDHWLASAENQRLLYAMTQALVGKLAPGETDLLVRLFPRYIEPAQTGQVRTVRQAAQAFGLGSGTESLALVLLSVMVTALNSWLAYRHGQALNQLALTAEADRQALQDSLSKAIRDLGVGARQGEAIRPLLAEEVAATLGDVYTPYEQSLQRLRARVGHNLELLTYEQQLRENISRSRRYGSTPDLDQQRSEIIERLNRFALQTIGQPFDEF